MIGILSKEINSIFLKKLDLEYVFLDNEYKDIDGLFIDWVPKLPYSEDAWLIQASFLQHYIKMGIPITIFDRYFYLNEKEVNWINKFNVSLFEPALNSGRQGFRYLPEWIDFLNIETEYNDEREYDLIYSGIDYNIPEFEKWIVEYAILFPEKKVGYSIDNLSSEFKKEEYKKNNLKEINLGYTIGKTTVAIDSKKSYQRGYFDSRYFDAMRNGCLPFLPIQHKYFHGLFNGLIIENIKELDLHVSMFSKLKDTIIEEIFERIREDWNEFTIEHAVDIIRNSLQ
jgi:hypothetical protein